MIFHAAWKVISTLVDPDTREKIQVFKDGDQFLAAAKGHGSPLEALPQYLGGSHAGRAMDQTFQASVPDTPFPSAGKYIETPTTQS